MRLWHYKLIPALPDFMLVQQWRTCIEIARKIAKDGTITDPLIKRLVNYPAEHFLRYVIILQAEMGKRENMLPPNWQVRAFNDNLKKAVDCKFDDEECYGCIRKKGQSDPPKMTKCRIFCMCRYKDLDAFSFSLRHLFADWHDLKYLSICYTHLLELKDCGVITEEDFSKIHDLYNKVANEHCCMDISSQKSIDKAYEDAMAKIKVLNDET